MMGQKILVVSDLHLLEGELEEYRWTIFLQLTDLIVENNVRLILILGDLFDRKDRHAGTLINRTIEALRSLGIPIMILAGNHDAPMDYENYYWKFLNRVPGLTYIMRPEHISIEGVGIESVHVWLLPFSHNPAEDWKDLALGHAQALFMHQTMAGAVLNGDNFKAERDANPMPTLPDIPIYSGDVHRPQVVDNVVYVGVPYPTRFGETWPCRCLLLDTDDLGRYVSIPLDNIKRRVLETGSLDQLYELAITHHLRKGDQIRVRFSLTQDSITNWTETEACIKTWARERGFNLLSVEATFAQVIPHAQDTTVATQAAVEELSHETILNLYASEEKLSQELVDVGLELLRSTE
jgi:DNA repair exonuclease SbcCD nuclease subunit